MQHLPLELLNGVALRLPLHDVAVLSQVNRDLHARVDVADIAHRQLNTLLKSFLAKQPPAEAAQKLKFITDAIRWEQWFDGQLQHSPAAPHRHLPPVSLKSLREICYARYRMNDETASFCLRIPLVDGGQRRLVETMLHYTAASQYSNRYEGNAQSVAMTMDVSPELAQVLPLPKDAPRVLLWWRGHNFQGEYQRSENVPVLQALADLFNRALVGGVTDWTGPRVRDMLATLTHTIWYKTNTASPNQAPEEQAMRGKEYMLDFQTTQLWDETKYNPLYNERDKGWASMQYQQPVDPNETSDRDVDRISTLLASISRVPQLRLSGCKRTKTMSNSQAVGTLQKTSASKDESVLDSLLSSIDEARIAYLTSPTQIFARAAGKIRAAPISDLAQAALTPLLAHCTSDKSYFSEQRFPDIDQDTGYGEAEYSFGGDCTLHDAHGGKIAQLSISYYCMERWESETTRELSFLCTLLDDTGASYDLCDAEVLASVAAHLGIQNVPDDDLLAVLFTAAVGPNVSVAWAWRRFHNIEDLPNW
ncbi:hypothetical protein RI367_007965 [Sorochytrium milnesiophthora]